MNETSQDVLVLRERRRVEIVSRNKIDTAGRVRRQLELFVPAACEIFGVDSKTLALRKVVVHSDEVYPQRFIPLEEREKMYWKDWLGQLSGFLHTGGNVAVYRDGLWNKVDTFEAGAPLAHEIGHAIVSTMKSLSASTLRPKGVTEGIAMACEMLYKRILSRGLSVDGFRDMNRRGEGSDFNKTWTREKYHEWYMDIGNVRGLPESKEGLFWLYLAISLGGERFKELVKSTAGLNDRKVNSLIENFMRKPLKEVGRECADYWFGKM